MVELCEIFLCGFRKYDCVTCLSHCCWWRCVAQWDQPHAVGAFAIPNDDDFIVFVADDEACFGERCCASVVAELADR